MRLTEICEQYAEDVDTFLQGGDMSDELYQVLYNYYFLNQSMPYTVAKARGGDPYEWVCLRFDQDIYNGVDLEL